MPAAKKRPGDLTGLQTEALQKENAELLRERAKEITMLNEQIAEEKREVIDLSAGVVRAGVEKSGVVEVEAPTKKVLLRDSVEHMVYGRDRVYNLEAGRTYVLPRDVAEHLRERGYVWD